MRILVVEDERRLADSLCAGLRQEGYAVDVARNGTDGLWLAREHSYSAIVLDILLPGLNGYRVCQRLRSAGNATPIIMLTAKDGEHDQVDALDTGADDFLSKPFSYPVLLARLRALIRRGGSDRSSVLRHGELSLDLATKRCRRQDSEITLTAKECAVLTYLLERPGAVVSKRELLENVWDFASSSDPNLVEVHISALRRKIDGPFGTKTIVTVRGAGYRLGAVGG
jgi:DNA-binding response OmpR family regulator